MLVLLHCMYVSIYSMCTDVLTSECVFRITADAIKLLLKKREAELQPSAVQFWESLLKLHSTHGRLAATVPQMPYVSINGFNNNGTTFSGSPQDFLPLLRSLARFPRVLKCANNFDDKPPNSFQEAHMQKDEAQAPQTCGGAQARGVAGEQPELRDPRVENTIAHEEYGVAERNRAEKAAEQERFAEVTPARIERVHIGGLYLLELDDPEGGVRLGLGEVVNPSRMVHGIEVWDVLWFVLANKTGWAAQNPVFQQYKKNNVRQSDEIDIKSFRLQVFDVDLTAGSRASPRVQPKLSSKFAQQVKLFIAEHELGAFPAAGRSTAAAARRKRPRADAEDGGGGESDEDTSEDDRDSSNADDSGEDEDEAPEDDANVACKSAKDVLATPTSHVEAPPLFGIEKADPILILHEKWLKLILSGKKTMEIRAMRCAKYIGQHLWLCATNSFEVSGRVFFYQCNAKPMTKVEWNNARHRHLCDAADPPYKTTYGLEFKDAVIVNPPIPIGRTHAQIIQIGPAGRAPSKPK